jgi:putative ABC transport system permease protein
MDLWSNKTRTVLVVLSIAMGVFAVGYVQTLSVVLIGDMNADYQSVNPHSAVVRSIDDLSDDFVTSLRTVPGVKQIEGRSSVQGKVNTGVGQKSSISISAVQSYSKKVIDRIRPNTPGGIGSIKPLGIHEIYLERSAVNALGVKVGDTLNVELRDGRIRPLRVIDIVYDVTAQPYIFTNTATAYTTPDTMIWLGGTRDFNSVYFTVTERPLDQAHVKDVANKIVDRIEKEGASNRAFAFVMQPGRHWASDIIEALGMILGVLGFLAVLLSGFLVVNTVNSLLAQHVRQIGVMKAIGGHVNQIIGMYMIMILCFGILAAVFAVPLSAILGYATAVPMAGMLNFNIGSFRILPQIVLLQVAISMLIPLLTALIPVFKGVKVPAREALSDYGIGPVFAGQSLIDRLVENVRNLSRPMLISLRNTFRRKSRLALTLTALTLGGAIFIGIYNVRASINTTVNETMGYFLSDVNIFMEQAYREELIEPIIKSVSGVVSVEGWGMASGQLLSPDKKNSTDVMIIAPPAKSTLIKPVLTSGRWLVAEDENALVIGNPMVKLRPDLKVGDDVVLKINNEDSTWRIVGIYKIAGGMGMPTLYANYEELSTITNQSNQFAQFRAITDPHDINTQNRVVRELNEKLKSEGIKVQMIMSGAQIKAQQASAIDTIIMILLAMSVLIALVGGLGLTGTMSMNVMERTREIAVMRATGADDITILKMVIVEGVLIGLISWLLGIVIALPITIVLNNLIGSALLNTPLGFVLSLDGFLIWFGVVFVVSTLASALPARNASRLTIREALAYE